MTFAFSAVLFFLVQGQFSQGQSGGVADLQPGHGIISSHIPLLGFDYNELPKSVTEVFVASLFSRDTMSVQTAKEVLSSNAIGFKISAPDSYRPAAGYFDDQVTFYVDRNRVEEAGRLLAETNALRGLIHVMSRHARITWTTDMPASVINVEREWSAVTGSKSLDFPESMIEILKDRHFVDKVLPQSSLIVRATVLSRIHTLEDGPLSDYFCEDYWIEMTNNEGGITTYWYQNWRGKIKYVGERSGSLTLRRAFIDDRGVMWMAG